MKQAPERIKLGTFKLLRIWLATRSKLLCCQVFSIVGWYIFFVLNFDFQTGCAWDLALFYSQWRREREMRWPLTNEQMIATHAEQRWRVDWPITLCRVWSTSSAPLFILFPNGTCELCHRNRCGLCGEKVIATPAHGTNPKMFETIKPNSPDRVIKTSWIHWWCRLALKMRVKCYTKNKALKP